MTSSRPSDNQGPEISGMNPFPGLRPFQAEEAHLFFGRENYIDTILSKLRSYHFVSIVGNSGSGKSSLLRAGVIPRLSKDKDWIITTMRPGKSPVEELNSALTQIDHPEFSKIKTSDAATNLQTLQKSHLGLVQLLRNTIPEGKQLLLVVDQFEELFRFNKDQEEIAIQFVNLLLGAIQQRDVNINVIITLRSDFIGECEQFVGLPEAINNGQFLIPRMKLDELQLSITGPIEYVGQRISPRLGQQLLKDVGTNPDQLPILQHVLMRTWEVWNSMNDRNMPIDLIHYEKTGKMEKALSNHAEEAMLEIKSASHQTIIAILFKTLTVKESDNRGVRRPTSIAKIAEIANSSVEDIIYLVNIFRRADRGFLMPPANVPITEKSVIDISHESLMRVWERLDKWVDEEYESAQIYQRITASALLYEKGLSGLWRDPDLQIAIDWNKKYDVTRQWTEQYDKHFELSKRFLDASWQNKVFLEAEKNRKRRLTNIITVLVVVALSALSIWAFFERNNSAKNEQLALVEKQNALEQESIAKKQKKFAEESATKAEIEKRNAEKQKRIAVQNEVEANQQKKKAQVASVNANVAKNIAESEKKTALQQRSTADSLRKLATLSEKKAYRLLILSVAQTLAIKSAAMQKGSYDDEVKSLCAIQAYNFNKAFNGNPFNQDIYYALYAAHKAVTQEDIYKNNSHTDMVRSVSFSPDDKEIASCGSDGVMMICDAGNLQRVIKSYPKQSSILENIDYSPSGKTIACLGDKTDLVLFNTEGTPGMPSIISGLHMDKITGLKWLSDQLITVSLDNTLKITDSKTKKNIQTITLKSKPTCLTLNVKAQVAYIGCEDGTLLSVHLDESKEQQMLKRLNNKISSVAVSDNGQFVSAGLNDGKIEIIDLQHPEAGGIYLNQHKSTVTGLSFLQKGKKLVSSSFDGLVYLWDLAQPDQEPIAFKEHDSWVWDVACNNSGNSFCSAGKDKSIVSYISSDEGLVNSIVPHVKRNFSMAEWQLFVGNDIFFEPTIKGLK